MNPSLLVIYYNLKVMHWALLEIAAKRIQTATKNNQMFSANDLPAGVGNEIIHLMQQ